METLDDWIDLDLEHVVEFDAYGYGLQHPVACRPNLLRCPYNVHLASLDEPAREPGRYVMTFYDGWNYSQLA